MVGLFNNRKANSPWQDMRLRQAVNHAINRADLLRYAAKGNGIVTPSFLPPGAFGYDATLAPYAFDPARTRQLLQEAGYPEGFPIKLVAPQELSVQATVVSKMLEQVGFTVAVKMLDQIPLHKQVNRFWFLSPHGHKSPPAWPEWDIALHHMNWVATYEMYFLDGLYDWIHEQPHFRQLTRNSSALGIRCSGRR